MKNLLFSVLLTAITALPAFAQDYGALLSSGDAALAKQDYAAALADYAKAQEISTNSGERSFAIAKQALVKSEQKEYPEAKSLATLALEAEGLSAVCKATAYQALGVAQMKGDKDFADAAETFEKAVELPGVDWAQPFLNLLLGDCLRETGDSEGALEAYDRVIALPNASSGAKASAWFNIGLEQQYRLKNSLKAREAYDNAVQLNPALKAEAEKHSAKLS